MVRLGSASALLGLVLGAGLLGAGEGEGGTWVQAPTNDGVLRLEGVPPSPSTASGERIWEEPALTTWPVVVYHDEERNCAFRIEIREHGQAGTIGWDGGPTLPLTLPADQRIRSVSGLLTVPRSLGLHRATLALGARQHELRLRLVEAVDPWPHAGLREGFPVDAEGVPVVLVTRRRDFNLERRYSLFRPELPRPPGRPLLVGDPLAALGTDTWAGLDAEQRPIDEIRYPHHAALVALARLPEPLPRCLVWSPGNNVLFQRAWSPEETRVLEVLRTRCERLGRLPRLVLVLPPVPLDEVLAAEAAERRETLRQAALRLDWEVLDAERICGPAVQANRVAEGLYTRHPIGAARDRLRTELARLLAVPKTSP